MEQGQSDRERPDAESTRGICHSRRLAVGRARTEGRREYKVVIMRPGRVVQADGRLSNWLIPAEAIRDAAPLFEGVASYLDHPAALDTDRRGEPQVRNLVGVIFDPRWDEAGQALVAGLRLYDAEPHSPGALAGALLDQMLLDREQGLEVPQIGLSAVFYHDSREELGLRITTAFRKVESVDIVYAPGAGGHVRGVLAALSAAGGEPAKEERRNRMTEERKNEGAAGVPDGGPAADDGAPTSVQALAQQVATLTNQIAEMEAGRTIQGLGQPPRRPARISLGPTGLEQMQMALDWVFGVESASPPPPDLRRTDPTCGAPTASTTCSPATATGPASSMSGTRWRRPIPPRCQGWRSMP